MLSPSRSPPHTGLTDTKATDDGDINVFRSFNPSIEHLQCINNNDACSAWPFPRLLGAAQGQHISRALSSTVASPGPARMGLSAHPPGQIERREINMPNAEEITKGPLRRSVNEQRAKKEHKDFIRVRRPQELVDCQAAHLTEYLLAKLSE